MLTRIRPPGIINAETDNDGVSEEGAATGFGTWSEGAEVLGDGAAASLEAKNFGMVEQQQVL